MEPALMRAKPRCGHGTSFSKEREGQAADCLFEAAGSGNLASQQFHFLQHQPCDFVPVTITRAAALPAFGHAEPGWDESPLLDPTTCEPCRLAWSLHYSQPGNAK